MGVKRSQAELSDLKGLRVTSRGVFAIKPITQPAALGNEQRETAIVRAVPTSPCSFTQLLRPVSNPGTQLVVTTRT